MKTLFFMVILILGVSAFNAARKLTHCKTIIY